MFTINQVLAAVSLAVASLSVSAVEWQALPAKDPWPC